MTKEIWENIKNDSPKAFDLFCNKYIDINIPDIYVSYSENTEDYIVYAEEQLCFCDILKFFEDSVGIEIFINRNIVFHYYYEIITKDYKIIISEEKERRSEVKNSREEAQDAATIKAFSILNTMIENER